MNPDAFPETVSPEVRTLMEEMIHLSNSASTHTEHEKDEAAFANLFTNDGIYEFAGKQGVGHKGPYCSPLGLYHRLHRFVANADF